MNHLLELPLLAASETAKVPFGLPLDVSVDGYRIDWLINITAVFTGILFVIMVVWLVGACWLHGPKHQAQYDHGDGRRQVIMALSLSAIIFLIVDGNLFVNSTIDLNYAFWNFSYAEEHPEALRIEVNARQWAWEGRYAGPDKEFNTQDDIVTLNYIPIPEGVPVIVHLAAVDVIHAFYLPNFRVKMDAVPGMINKLWFQATDTGKFDIACAQHCGTSHYKMKGQLEVMSKEDFRAWHDEASKNAAIAYDPDDESAHWGWAWKTDGGKN